MLLWDQKFWHKSMYIRIYFLKDLEHQKSRLSNAFSNMDSFANTDIIL